jgi:hypothetical protein
MRPTPCLVIDWEISSFPAITDHMPSNEIKLNNKDGSPVGLPPVNALSNFTILRFCG